LNEKTRAKLKDIEVRLIAELMKNSRRSDRELAKIVGVSQPTVTRIRGRLEKEGIIKEYTMIPDFSKLGFDVMSVNFVRFKSGTPEIEIERLRKTARQLEGERGLPYLLVMSGVGLGHDRVFIMLHKDYGSYATVRRMMMGAARGNVEDLESFLVVLNKEHYLPLTLSALAGYLSLEDKRVQWNREREM